LLPALRRAHYVERLEAKDRIDVQRLSTDEGFLDLLLHSTVAAMRTRHLEKRQALSSAVAHAAVAINADRDEELLFVRYVDEMLPSHLELPRYLDSHEREIADTASYQQLLDGYLGHLVAKHTQPVSRDLFRVLCADLLNRGLVRISRNVEDFPGLKDNDVIIGEHDRPSGTATVLVTDIGHRFVRYIETPHG
jgi:hypothetical protein